MYRLHVFSAPQLVSLRFYGNVDFPTLIRANKEVVLHPEFDPCFAGIADFRDCQIHISLDEIRNLAHWNNEDRYLSAPWVHLVNSPGAETISTEYQHQVRPSHLVEVCHDLEIAGRFLGLSEITPYLLPKS